MVYDLLAQVSSFIVNTISDLGYLGIAGLMALESACIPIPSEIIMPFSGFLVSGGRFSLAQVVLWGTIGNLIGSLIAYFLGVRGRKPLIGKYGKYILISSQDLEVAQRWFERRGDFGIFFSRLLPVIRTFISLPAGIAKMPLKKFSVYTFLGCLPWVFVLTYTGVLAGENWESISIYFRKFDWLIGFVLLVGIGWWMQKKLKAKS